MKTHIIIVILFFLLSCSGGGEVGKILRNEKTNTTDEFLVKKKEPLILPPDFKEIPQPGSIKDTRAENEEQKIKKIIKVPVQDESDGSSSTEESIIDRIRRE
ncbi:MAG: DUF3035 domain-containing protein [Pseudomonadota bacterium]|nr:DUF3035 domain-containing protein [Pseudomonadota bacterium]|tara:strand:+ start:403 stop:708 length:306 start_codon:yes stop_codon:yes gene_type:complete